LRRSLRQDGAAGSGDHFLQGGYVLLECSATGRRQPR
jgi:hypothetical protein